MTVYYQDPYVRMCDIIMAWQSYVLSASLDRRGLPAGGFVTPATCATINGRRRLIMLPSVRRMATFVSADVGNFATGRMTSGSPDTRKPISPLSRRVCAAVELQSTPQRGMYYLIVPTSRLLDTGTRPKRAARCRLLAKEDHCVQRGDMPFHRRSVEVAAHSNSVTRLYASGLFTKSGVQPSLSGTITPVKNAEHAAETGNKYPFRRITSSLSRSVLTSSCRSRMGGRYA